MTVKMMLVSCIYVFMIYYKTADVNKFETVTTLMQSVTKNNFPLVALPLSKTFTQCHSDMKQTLMIHTRPQHQNSKLKTKTQEQEIK